VSVSDAWEQHAKDWIRWARTPSHDGFWTGTWPELRTLVPAPDGLVVEIGCGEGRVGRELLGLGHAVVGVERSATLVHAARTADPPLTVVHADAAALPINDASARTVVACMSLHDVDDLDGTVHEIARVLEPGGRLCVAMVHPFASAQEPSTFHSYEPVVRDSYLRSRRYEDRMERDGLEMTHVSVHRPLSAYFSLFAAAGLTVSDLRELGNKPIPWLLCMRLEKVRAGAGSGSAGSGSA
jgi:SAM-dependent methyltransferase